MPYKPAGYTSVSPYLIVTDAEATLAFAARAFGAETLFVHRDAAGSVVHAEFRLDDSVVMCGQASEAASAHVHLYLPDVDAAFRRALDAGASVVQEPAEKGDGDRRGGVAGPSGTVWWLSTQVAPRRT